MQQPSMVSAFLFLPQLPSMTYGPDEIKINHFLLSVALVRVVYHSNIMKWSNFSKLPHEIYMIYVSEAEHFKNMN